MNGDAAAIEPSVDMSVVARARSSTNARSATARRRSGDAWWAREAMAITIRAPGELRWLTAAAYSSWPPLAPSLARSKERSEARSRATCRNLRIAMSHTPVPATTRISTVRRTGPEACQRRATGSSLMVGAAGWKLIIEGDLARAFRALLAEQDIDAPVAGPTGLIYAGGIELTARRGRDFGVVHSLRSQEAAHGVGARVAQHEVVFRLAAGVGVTDELDRAPLEWPAHETLGHLLERARVLTLDVRRVEGEVGLGLGDAARFQDRIVDVDGAGSGCIRRR